MNVGDVAKFLTDQAKGYENRQKLHVYLGKTNDFRAPDEYVFQFISSSDYGGCFPIVQEKYPKILEHNSYISCNNLVFYSYDFLKNSDGKIVGALSIEDLARLRTHLIDHEIMASWEITLACSFLPISV